jgi:hypothetical protein
MSPLQKGHLKSATDFELDARLGTDAACGRLCCEIIAFKTSLAISNREGLTSGKSAFGANFVIWE